MNKHIVLLNTAHYSSDDRVFYHQAACLSENGYRVSIVSTLETVKEVKNKINICSCDLNSLPFRKKQQKMREQLEMLAPDMVICDTPNAVLSARRYRKKHKIKIIYDITEWYPSHNNVKHTQGVKKWLKCIALILFYIYAGAVSNGFIFGEYYKSRIFRFFYRWKPFVFLPYFPDLKYIKPLPVQDIKHTMRLFYGGSVQPQRGMKQVIQSAIMAAKKKPETMFQLHLICNLPAEDGLFLNKLLADSIPSNLKIHYVELLPFVDFCRYVSQMDLCFDLRTISWEHSHSLPIKLFYYLACGRPVVYSRLKSVTAFFPAISFGYVVNPSDIERIATIITHYIDHADNYTKHCQEALNLSVEKYNWDKIKGDFVQFIQKT